MRSRSLLLSLTLVAGGLGGVLAPGGPSAAVVPDPGTFAERWCSGPATTDPCIESATHNGVAMSPGTGAYRVQLTGMQTNDTSDYVMWQIVPDAFGQRLPVGDDWSVTLDMGTTKPRYTEGFSGGLVVTRTPDGDGTFHVTMAGKSVQMAESCNDSYPPVCQNPTPYDETTYSNPDIYARGVYGAFLGEVWDLDRDTDPGPGDASWRNGFDRSQNVDGVNEPDVEVTSDGSYRLYTETYNAATYDDDGVPGTAPKTFKGEFRFRLPYSYLRDRLHVPDPDTLPASGLTGSTTGTGAGVWDITKNATDKYFLAEVTGVTYPDTVAARTFARAASTTQTRTLRVKRGVITPYAPKNVSATRTATGRGRVSYAAAKPRGARPTGYTVRCVNLAGTHTVTVNDAASPTAVTGLRTGKAYDCRVRARSKVGPGAWSVKVRMPARP